jgi:serine/threonine protein kinase
MGFELGKTVAGYEITEVLGSSKTGLAYKVRNVFAQRYEVLKVLLKGVQDTEEHTARFLREIKVHARLVHPNIVTFYNAREIEGQLVMTTEFVPGITLAERMESGPLAWRDATRYACQALSALEYAHANGIIHRGLAASSLLITNEGSARLGGFGLAKSSADPQLTAVGTVVGALRYISPEQVRGGELDARCDIYSLGVVLYEMLAGKLPFESKGQFEMMLAHVNTPPKHPSDVNAEVPRELGDIVMKALAKEPDQRFQNAREFRMALERLGLDRDAFPAAVAVSNSMRATAVAAPSITAAAAEESNGTQEAVPPPVPAVRENPAQHMVQPMAVAAFAGARSAGPAQALEFLPVQRAPLFGGTFVSKLVLSLAVCVITFLIGSVAVLALLAITRP